MHHIISLLIQTVATVTQHGSATHQFKGVIEQLYWPRLKASLLVQGFEFLGAGHFAFVMAHPELPEQAIKIGLKVEDSGASYAAYCRMKKREGDHPHLPEIIATHRLDGFYLIQMEKLVSLGSLYCGSYREDAEDSKWCHANRAFWAAHRALYNLRPTTEDEGHKSVIEATRGIRAFFDGIANFDLHADNVMVRKDGTLVITDPVSYTMKGLKDAREAREAREVAKRIQAHKIAMAHLRDRNVLMPIKAGPDFKLNSQEVQHGHAVPNNNNKWNGDPNGTLRHWAHKLHLEHPFTHNKP